MQDIASFTRVSGTDTNFGARDLSISALGSPAPVESHPRSEIGAPEPQQACIQVDIERASLWLPDSSFYVLAALAANVAELCRVVSRRSSGDVLVGASSKVSPSYLTAFFRSVKRETLGPLGIILRAL